MSQEHTQNKAPQTQKSRDLDPNVHQRQASNPQSCVWVNASAGTGKTKVLTDRVLRLLLPQSKHVQGADPSKILCLTFTKAAANEMALRISETLAQWAIIPDQDLAIELKKLSGHEPQDYEITAARKLFARISDTPGGMKIMTLHAFCQSLMARFPLETGIAPGFKTLEETEAETLLTRAISKSAEDKNAEEYQAIQQLLEILNQDQLTEIIKHIASERYQLRTTMQKHFSPEGLYTALCQKLNIPANQTREEILHKACNDAALNIASLKTCANHMINSQSTEDQKKGTAIATWLSHDDKKRTQTFDTYILQFLTTEGELRKRLVTKKTLKQNPEILDVLNEEANRLIEIKENINKSNAARQTKDLFTAAQSILKHYETLKRNKNVLDYDDLIIMTLDLLNTQPSWVMYKLDNGLEHVLIDEAQDTNPEQWQIIDALCAEFYAGHGTNEKTRTLFVVGDEKQSIYSFQRASPEAFKQMRKHFEEKIQSANQQWNQVDLNISFRSTQTVLDAVDYIFNTPETRTGVSDQTITHHSFRRHQEGIVELWPLEEPDEASADSNPWEPPITIKEHKTGEAKLSQKIAETIENWITRKETLPSRNRPIKPSDILILVRQRNTFVHQLIRALKNKNIPVNGIDRLILTQDIAVQDILSLIEFALLPSDDLTLATILKSPLINLSEEDVYGLCYNRNGSIWEELKSQKLYKDTQEYLETLIKKSNTYSPYAFINAILNAPCPADNKSGWRAIRKRLGEDAIDPIDEFLNETLSYEQKTNGSLQEFSHHQRKQETVIKREMDDQNNAVKIMTVHGAKGLQAPIVILPDTILHSASKPQNTSGRLLWPNKTDFPLPLWTSKKENEFKKYKELKDTLEEREKNEYKRLLYVAMTRAEDRLYIAGYTKKTKPHPSSWYILCQQRLKQHPESITTDQGHVRLTNPQINEPDRIKASDQANLTASQTLPEWIDQDAPKETQKHKTRTASYVHTAIDLKRFERGLLMHSLFEILPNHEPELWEEIAQDLINTQAPDMNHKQKEEIAQSALTILNTPKFKDIFGSNAHPEIPITGTLKDGSRVNGRIDRLLITDKEITIIDFKTDQIAPQTIHDVPPEYQTQMSIYGEILMQIYPNHTIKAALLWTNGPNLMPIPLDLG